MIRLALSPILVIFAVFSAPNPKEQLIAKYKQFNAIYQKSDRVSMDSWIKSNCISKFSYTSYHKVRYSKEGFRNSVLQDMQSTTKVIKSTLVVRSVEAHGDHFVAIIVSDFKGNVSIDSRKYVLSDQSVETDTWIQEGKDWKIQNRVQVNEDMQLQPAE
jgi:hypothetical protein